MIQHFLDKHRATAGLLLAAFLAASGYIRFRFDRGGSLAGISSFVIAFVIVCLVLSGVPASGPVGFVFLGVALALGIAGIVYLMKRKENR